MVRTQRSLVTANNTGSSGAGTTLENGEMETETTTQSQEERDVERMLNRFVTHILPVLSAIGPGLSYDATLFSKLIRICQAFLKETKLASQHTDSCSTDQVSAGRQSNGESYNMLKEQTPPPQDIRPRSPGLSPAQIVKQMSKSELAFFNQIYTLLNEILLPSLSMLNMNPCVAIEIWNLLKLFPFEMRYLSHCLLLSYC